MESTLEGCHIRTTHPESFCPYGYDNLNVVETFARNSRIAFPFRRIEKLRNMPSDALDVSGKLTYAYNLFPNVTIAVLSNHTVVSISEPVSPTRTRFVSYRLNNQLDGKLSPIWKEPSVTPASLRTPAVRKMRLRCLRFKQD